MMMRPSLTMRTLYLEKIAMQSSSHSLPMDIKEPVVRPFKMWPVVALDESCGARGICAVWEEDMVLPSAARTEILVEEGMGLEQCCWSWTVR